jgi:hypothetical protein
MHQKLQNGMIERLMHQQKHDQLFARSVKNYKKLRIRRLTHPNLQKVTISTPDATKSEKRPTRRLMR